MAVAARSVINSVLTATTPMPLSDTTQIIPKFESHRVNLGVYVNIHIVLIIQQVIKIYVEVTIITNIITSIKIRHQLKTHS